MENSVLNLLAGAKVWNSLDEDLKNLNKTPFKKQLFKSIINSYIT